ncbi:uncharacterized protein LOC142784032 isoform X1 [Rhipicephalus microplus]|uniref:uncharacterized protein LOC142784032 isoform X1 n=1 Tax=Rhipicephalus microplus TaxID=6941 RepID=UPI003F6C0792
MMQGMQQKNDHSFRRPDCDSSDSCSSNKVDNESFKNKEPCPLRVLQPQASKTETTCTFATTMCCHAGTTTATTDSPEVAHSSVREAALLINYVPTDREVHRSKGIAVPKSLYNTPMGLKRQTRFVREAAVIIFYTAGQVGRSVTGAASNRSKGEAKSP